MTALAPHQWRDRALSAFRSGDVAAAIDIFKKALDEYPDNAALWNGAGDILLKSGSPPEAATHFGRAAQLDPGNIDFAINFGIALSSCGRNEEALAEYRRVEKAGQNRAIYCSSRGTAARAAKRPAEAQVWYDKALALEPNRIKALHGRARVALERGATDALQWFDRALSVNQGDADLWLGKAQALDVMGEAQEALQIAEALVQQAPAWTEGLRFMAQLRLQAGDQDFASHYGDAVRRVPQDPNIYSAWCSTLGSLEHNGEATEVAAQARRTFPNEEHFAFLEAVHASLDGQSDRAELIYADLAKQDDDRWLQEARHRIRRAEFTGADDLLDRILEQDPWNIAAWALRGALWRQSRHPKSEWLHEQANLVRLMPLHDADIILPKVVPFLHELHDRSPFPIGQSLRGGTQTRGNLFDRSEVVLAELKSAIMETVQEYQNDLPPHDPAHPLLRTCEMNWDMVASWSVRLAGGGDFHTSHIHPQGIVSSALYLELPEDRGSDPEAGWLEIGRPARDLNLDLEPLTIIEPKVGHLALFPSTLYHGTRPFHGDRRMTVAFDINLLQRITL